MLRYAAERLILMVPAFVAIAALIFIVIQLPPGDFLSNEIAELRSKGDAAVRRRSNSCARSTASTGR